MKDALDAAKGSYEILPWLDASVTQLAGLWIENDELDLAYNFLLDHINRFGRTPEISVAMASTSLYYGIESNMDYELDWLKENMNNAEWVKTKLELEVLRNNLRTWE